MGNIPIRYMMGGLPVPLGNVTYPEYKVVLPHQMGWLRRKELDTPSVNIWELPDGTLYAEDPSGPPTQLIVSNRKPTSQ